MQLGDQFASVPLTRGHPSFGISNLPDSSLDLASRLLHLDSLNNDMKNSGAFDPPAVSLPHSFTYNRRRSYTNSAPFEGGMADTWK